MQSVLTFLDGKKTYITAAVTAVIAFIQAMGYPVPEYVYALLAAFGITTLRAAVAKTER